MWGFTGVRASIHQRGADHAHGLNDEATKSFWAISPWERPYGQAWEADSAVEIGFTLSSEEQGPKDLVHLARAAEEAGFSFATISDHFHPWTSQQGNSPFVWSVLGRSPGPPARSALGPRSPAR